MAKFRVIKSENVKTESGEVRARLDFELVEGALLPGDVFRLYETHHYTNYMIEHLGESHIIARPSLWTNGIYEGEVLDTDDLKAARKRGYSS
jgi:hypothetical protein